MGAQNSPPPSRSEEQQMGIMIWAIMEGFRQDNIAMLKSDTSALSEWRSVKQRLASLLFTSIDMEAVTFIKLCAKEKAKTWKSHAYHNELSLGFPLRKYTTFSQSYSHYVEGAPYATFGGEDKFVVASWSRKAERQQWALQSEHKACMECGKPFGKQRKVACRFIKRIAN